MWPTFWLSRRNSRILRAMVRKDAVPSRGNKWLVLAVENRVKTKVVCFLLHQFALRWQSQFGKEKEVTKGREAGGSFVKRL